MRLTTLGQYQQLNTPGIGKPVVFAPNLKEEAKTLVKAVNKGYFYPLMAMRQLAALSTGYSGKNNVFIPNINDFKTNSLQQVVVFVPGIAATVERRSNDTLVITKLVLSSEYEGIQRGNRQKPGIYSVSRGKDTPVVKYKNNGRITAKDERKVVIADTDYKDPIDAAEEAVNRLQPMFGSNSSQKSNFDLFYSPLGSKLKGMKNYNPTAVTKTYGYAGLLADAMEQSKNLEGVEWVSDRSGSVVLTQALMTLAAKNTSFEGQSHFVKMCWATSNPKPAYETAIRLHMLVDEGIHKSNSNFVVSMSAKMAGIARVKDKDDPYTLSDYGKELSNGTFTLAAAVGSVSSVGALAVGGGSVGSVLAVAGTVAGVVGFSELAVKILKDRKERR